MQIASDMLHCNEDMNETLTPSNRKTLCSLAQSNEIARAFYDLNIFENDKVLTNLLAIEDKYQTTFSYFSFQDDIKPYMRKIVTNWMLEVCIEQSRDEDVFLLAVSYLDRFLSLVRIARTQLQLVATVCIFIASKMKEPHYLDAAILVAYTDSSITLQELLDWELQLLCVINWETSLVIANDFFELLLYRLPLENEDKKTILHHSQTFATLCATEHCFITYSPSVIATACICTSIAGLKSQTWIENRNIYTIIKKYTSIEPDYIKACQKQIEDLHLLNSDNNNNVAEVSKESRLTTTPLDIANIIVHQ